MSELLWQPPQEQITVIVLLCYCFEHLWASEHESYCVLFAGDRVVVCSAFTCLEQVILNICVNSEIAQMFVFRHQTPKPWKQIKFGM